MDNTFIILAGLLIMSAYMLGSIKPTEIRYVEDTQYIQECDLLPPPDEVMCQTDLECIIKFGEHPLEG